MTQISRFWIFSYPPVLCCCFSTSFPPPNPWRGWGCPEVPDKTRRTSCDSACPKRPRGWGIQWRVLVPEKEFCQQAEQQTTPQAFSGKHLFISKHLQLSATYFPQGFTLSWQKMLWHILLLLNKHQLGFYLEAMSVWIGNTPALLSSLTDPGTHLLVVSVTPPPIVEALLPLLRKHCSQAGKIIKVLLEVMFTFSE